MNLLRIVCLVALSVPLAASATEKPIKAVPAAPAARVPVAPLAAPRAAQALQPLATAPVAPAPAAAPTTSLAPSVAAPAAAPMAAKEAKTTVRKASFMKRMFRKARALVLNTYVTVGLILVGVGILVAAVSSGLLGALFIIGGGVLIILGVV